MSKEYDPGDYNKSGMKIFITSMVVTMVFFVYVAFIHEGVDLKEIPKAEETKAEVEAGDDSENSADGTELSEDSEVAEDEEDEEADVAENASDAENEDEADAEKGEE